MRWWPIVGMTKMMTEDKKYESKSRVKRMKLFKKSLNIYTIDVGNCNVLNFEMQALKSPKYNIHRFGIYSAASPKHADLLIVLGRPTKKMVEPLRCTIEQLPEPFGILLIKGCGDDGIDPDELKLPKVVASMDGCPNPSEILAVLLKISGRTD